MSVSLEVRLRHY